MARPKTRISKDDTGLIFKEATVQEETPAPAPKVGSAKTTFVKNLNPSEVITFENGEQFQFPKLNGSKAHANVLKTEDKKLIANLESILTQYNIIKL
jgi:hypothetical protein